MSFIKLTAYNLKGIFNSCKKESCATITIDEPVVVFQEYDKKAVMANVELAGFRGIKTGNTNTFLLGLWTKVNIITKIDVKNGEFEMGEWMKNIE